jgi:hypothetical protein
VNPHADYICPSSGKSHSMAIPKLSQIGQLVIDSILNEVHFHRNEDPSKHSPVHTTSWPSKSTQRQKIRNKVKDNSAAKEPYPQLSKLVLGCCNPRRVGWDNCTSTQPHPQRWSTHPGWWWMGRLGTRWRRRGH